MWDGRCWRSLLSLLMLDTCSLSGIVFKECGPSLPAVLFWGEVFPVRAVYVDVFEVDSDVVLVFFL